MTESESRDPGRDPAPQRPVRADARRNRDKLLAAAREAFAATPDAVPLDAIARAAGVGIGTLYRHFPTREALVHAVTGTDIAGLASTGLPDGPAIDALRVVCTAMVTHLADNKAISDLLAAGTPAEEDVARCVAHLTRLGQEAIDRADHTLAPGVTADDIAYHLLGLIRVAQLRAGDPAAVERHVHLTLRGLT